MEAIAKHRKKQKTRESIAGSSDGKERGAQVQQEQKRRSRPSRHPQVLQNKVHATADSTGPRSSRLERTGGQLKFGESPSPRLSSLLQNCWDGVGSGVWVRVGPGKWKAQRREAPPAAAPALLSSSLPCASTQVVVFDDAPGKSDRRTSELLRSDVRWNAFLATVHSELGHEIDGLELKQQDRDQEQEQQQQQLAVEDLE